MPRKPGQRWRFGCLLVAVYVATALACPWIPEAQTDHLWTTAELVIALLGGAIGADTVRPSGQARAAFGGTRAGPVIAADVAVVPTVRTDEPPVRP